MLGAIRKTVIGAGALGLLTVGLATHSTPVGAVGPESVCGIVESPADIFNVEMYNKSATHGHSNQAIKGSWEWKPGVFMPRFGLYYPNQDPVADHVVPNQESHGAAAPIPATPLQTGDRFVFKQAGKCTGYVTPGFSTEGVGIGYCGRSVGLGTGTVDGHPVIIRWESAGSQLIMLHPSAAGSVNARPNPPGDTKGSCLDGTAITFSVDGALSDLR